MRGTYPPGVTKTDINDAIEEYERDAEHYGFKPSTDYDLVLLDGRRLPPKAIAGIATRRVLGRAMLPSEFSAGEGQACFRALRRNGFRIEPKPERQRTALDQPDGWTDDELCAAVGAYLEMFALEQSGTPYSKTEYNGRLREGGLKARTRSAVEYRMANISTALAEVGLPWIKGYKPLSHIGERVKQRLLRLLAQTPAGFDLMSQPAEEEREVQSRTKVLLQAKTLAKPVGVKKPVPVDRTAKRYARSPEVQAFVLQEAEGCCELCQEPAPFQGEDGVPFLEVHHVVPLADGGPDTEENAAALCPNCHRHLHHGQDRLEARVRLYSQVGRLRPPR